jgi:TolB-like protein/tetratricopeptide (TPR) repeat protein
VLACFYVAVSVWKSRASAAPVASSTSTKADPASILVLPFRDLSPEQDQEYFSAGITEELINALTRVPGLRVIPRTSAFRFSDENHDRRAVTRDLNVGTVLEGSVRKFGDRVRVSVQVTDVAGGHTLWADTYDRALKDVLVVQQEIAHAVISSLRGRISVPPRPLPNTPTTNVEAFNQYLKGRYHWNRRTEDSLKKAITHFSQALAEDPRYAAAYSGLADSYSLLAHRGTSPSGELMPKAKAAALKALAIDETLAEAHSSLGYVNLFFEWKWAEAERSFKRALELNPQYVPAHQWYAFALMAAGRANEALSHAQEAEKLDPLSPNVMRSVADMHYRMREYDRAIAKCREALDLEPHFTPAYSFMGRAYLQKRLFPEAIAAFERSASLSDESSIATAMVAHAYALWGKQTHARKMLKDLETRAAREYVDPYYVGLVYSGLGEQENALAWLERACSERSVWVASLPIDPRFDALKDHPRFKAMVARLRA